MGSWRFGTDAGVNDVALSAARRLLLFLLSHSFGHLASERGRHRGCSNSVGLANCVALKKKPLGVPSGPKVSTSIQPARVLGGMRRNDFDLADPSRVLVCARRSNSRADFIAYRRIGLRH
jgi:hypothetical protein